MTSIRRAVITLVLGVGLATPLGGRQQPAAPMNVVVLVIDDTRWDSIGAAGNRIVRTPHARPARVRGRPLQRRRG